MKYLKNFEGRESDYSKKDKYQYLEIEEEKMISDFITDYIKNLNILDKIDKLTLSELESDRFEYRTIFNNLIGINNSYTEPNSFYRNIDNFIKEHKIESSITTNRNTVFKIEDKMYKYYKPEFIKKVDNRIIEFVSNITDLAKFKKYYEKYSNNFSSKVKGAFDFMFNADKFNL